MRSSLMIFGKVPRAGGVKTRLSPIITADEAAELYRCMLHDTLAKAATLSGICNITVFHEPGDEAERYFQETARGMATAAQEGKDLGERMAGAFEAAFAKGATEAVIIGTDVPHVPAPVIAQAFEYLRDATDVVFGPSADGGYYLVGMTRLHPELFRNIPWSTGTVLTRSRDIASEQGLGIRLLPLLHDVDTSEDLLRPELLDEENGAPLTRCFLRNLFQCRPQLLP